ncbi:anhydro-N-acetylmuramic acid kinase [Tumebacillus sp. DT12]|uniref:Anhydro-N-acetylmuramic acid kinase n=1 Tax=Tumebacillus lacus TaxID=2995335 RepID=A0ABT3WVW0_9BACL|nr:anhydro-N-acetylmuramic acid kinase [Tumebacillus lacus]MCX7568818.1 anhydro-N-acetylmuramic acid kinase [Tumebacillus lacus]
MKTTEQQPLTCIGLMSGTSVDGVDVAIVDLTGAPPSVGVKLRHFQTVPFTDAVRSEVFKLFSLGSSNSATISQMNFLLGRVFAEAVLTALSHAGIAREEITFIASHGQTVWHSPTPEPLAGYDIASTLQIGEASVIAEHTGIPVISDFRVRDVAAGGQGAPLVPFVDALLFADPTGQTGRITANIGGIANLTVLPAGGVAAGERVIAFDTGPGNMILDGLVRRATGGAQTYDKDGKIARSGRIIEEYLQEWLSLPYFRETPPKSTGRELFGEPCVEMWWRDGQERGYAPEDLIATATEFTVRTFTEAIQHHVLPHHAVEEIIIGGGGAYNPLLLAGIGAGLPGIRILPQEATGIPSDAKEAVAFAILGYECYHRRPNNLPSATGAHRPVVMGKIVWT